MNPHLPGNPSYIPPTEGAISSTLPPIHDSRIDSVQSPNDREQNRVLNEANTATSHSEEDPSPLLNVTLGPSMTVNDTNVTLVWVHEEGGHEGGITNLSKEISSPFANVTFSPALLLGKDVRDQPLRLLTGDWLTLESTLSRRYLARGDAHPLPGDPQGGSGRDSAFIPSSSSSFSQSGARPSWIHRGWNRFLGIFGSKRTPAQDRDPKISDSIISSRSPSVANADQIREAVASQSSGQEGLNDVMGDSSSPLSPSFSSSSFSGSIMRDGAPMIPGHYASDLQTLQNKDDNRTAIQFEVLDRTHVRIRLHDLSYLSLSPSNASKVCAGSWGPEGALIFRVVRLADGLIRLHSAKDDSLVLTHFSNTFGNGRKEEGASSQKKPGLWSRLIEKKRQRQGLPPSTTSFPLSSSEELILSPLLTSHEDFSPSPQQWRVRALPSRKVGYEERMSGVQYDVEGAQARMTEREVVADLIFPNESKTAQQMSYAFSASLDLTHSTTWITQGTYEQTLTLEWGIPKFISFIPEAKGNVQAKIALVRSKMATETVQTTRTQSFTFSLTVPPQRQIRAAASALFANADIPFTASITRVLLAYNDDHLSKQQYAIEGILKEENFAEQRYHVGQDEPVDPGATRDPSIRAIPISDASPSPRTTTGDPRKGVPLFQEKNQPDTVTPTEDPHRDTGNGEKSTSLPEPTTTTTIMTVITTTMNPTFPSSSPGGSGQHGETR